MARYFYKYRFISIYTVLVIVSFLIFYYVLSLFQIKSVSIEGLSSVKGLQNYYGSYSFLLAEEEILKDLQNQNPTIESLHVYKHYPSSIYVIGNLKRPSAVLRLSDGSMTIAGDGTILTKLKQDDSFDVPPIQYYQPLFFNQYQVGELLDNKDIYVATFLSEKILGLGIKVSSIDIASENMIVLHTEKFDVFATSEKDVGKQFQELEYTYKHLSVEGKEFGSIDVRFEKPIIKLL